MINLEVSLKVVSVYISRLKFRYLTLETHFSSIKKQISATSWSQSIIRLPLSTQIEGGTCTKGKLCLIRFKPCNRQRLARQHFFNTPRWQQNRQQVKFRKSTQRDYMETSNISREELDKMCNLLMRVVKRQHSA